MKFLTVAAMILVIATHSLQSQADILRDNSFEVRYATSDLPLAEHSLAVLEESMMANAHVLPPGDEIIRVVICRTMEEFRRHSGIFDARLIEGIARSREGFIAIKSPRLLGPESNYDSILRHELLHVLLARNTNPIFLPRWLNEGIAMFLSRELRWGGPARVARMYLTRRLISYRGLNLSFAAVGNEEQFGDAYAQSLSMTQFLFDELGEETFWQIVDALNRMPFDEAIFRYANLSPMQFYNAWRDSLWQAALLSTLVSGFSIFQIGAILVVLAYLRKRRRGLAILDRWEEEEAYAGPSFLRRDDDDEPPEYDDLYEEEDEWP